MKLINNPDRSQWAEILKRPVMNTENLFDTVRGIIDRVKSDGDRAVLEMEAKFDKAELTSLAVTEAELKEAASPTASLSCFYLPLWGMPCPHIVQEGANGIDVGPLIQSPSLVLFGGCKAFCSIANRSFLAQRRQCRLIKINQF